MARLVWQRCRLRNGLRQLSKRFPEAIFQHITRLRDQSNRSKANRRDHKKELIRILFIL